MSSHHYSERGVARRQRGHSRPVKALKTDWLQEQLADLYRQLFTRVYSSATSRLKDDLCAAELAAIAALCLGDAAGVLGMAENHPGTVSDFRMGIALHEAGQTAAAIDLFWRVAATTDTALPHACLGIALQNAGRRAEADEAFRISMLRDPALVANFGGLAFRADDEAKANLTSRIPRPATAPGADGLAVTLVYAPITLPNVPLGIASIKAHLERNSPHRATCIDLSTAFNGFIAWAFSTNRVCRVPGLPLLDFAPVATEACGVFDQGGPEMFRQSEYKRLSQGLLSGLSLAHDVADKHCLFTIATGGPTPWYVRACAETILEGKPDVVGFSLMFEKQIAFTMALVRCLRGLAPKLKIVLGGCYLDPDLIDTIFESSLVDFVVLNDGEEPFLALLDALARGETAPAIANVFHPKARKPSQEALGRTTSMSKQAMPDFSDFDLGGYFLSEPVLPVLGSRGCYWRRCTFCQHFKSYSNSYSAATADRVVDEIARAVTTQGVRRFNFVDEMISASRFKKISEEIIARGLDITYYALAKPTADFTPEILQTMYRAGCRYLLWGVESGSQRILDLMDKGSRAADVPKVLHDAAAAGLRNHLFIMVGFPTETDEDMTATLRLLTENREVIHCIHGGGFMLMKGTPIHEQPERFGLKITNERRSWLGLAEVDYTASRGVSSAEAQHRGKVCHDRLFGDLAWFDNSLGALRNQALLIYSGGDRIVRDCPTPNLPAPEAVLAACRMRSPSEGRGAA